jgi:MYXO-CTERM domain-containing protein
MMKRGYFVGLFVLAASLVISTPGAAETGAMIDGGAWIPCSCNKDCKPHGLSFCSSGYCSYYGPGKKCQPPATDGGIKDGPGLSPWPPEAGAWDCLVEDVGPDSYKKVDMGPPAVTYDAGPGVSEAGPYGVDAGVAAVTPMCGDVPCDEAPGCSLAGDSAGLASLPLFALLLGFLWRRRDHDWS